MPIFENNGRNIHYVDVDNRNDKDTGIPLVLVHGAGSSHLSWSLQLRDLSKEYRMIAIDLSGHGQSDDIIGELSIEEHFVNDLDALIRKLEIDDFVCVGHSMGGVVVMSYVLKETSRKPRALVLVDTSSDIDLTKLGVGLAKDTIENRIRMFKDELFNRITDTLQVKKAEAKILSANPMVMLRDLAACNKFDITDRVREIDIPTFVIVGENDDIITPALAADFVKRFPRADIAVVKNADHIPMVEQPEEFNRLFRKFITWVDNNS
ncbi:MAG: alpha/beta fold hydrolase [Candidatus Thorarchaeota archaeon]